jgi:hypothetical protein
MLVCADDMNPLGDNIDTINKNTQTLINASKEVGDFDFCESRIKTNTYAVEKTAGFHKYSLQVGCYMLQILRINT